MVARAVLTRLRSALIAPRQARRRASLRQATTAHNDRLMKDGENSVYTKLFTLPYVLLIASSNPE